MGGVHSAVGGMAEPIRSIMIDACRANEKPVKRPYHLAVLQSHPIQYFAPLFRRLAREPEIDLTVYYCSHQGLNAYVDPGFGQAVQWDTPLLEGYHAAFLPNLRHTSQVGGFFSLMNVVVARELQRRRPDALWVPGHQYFSYVFGIAAAKALRVPVLMRCETHLGLSRSRLKRTLRGPFLRAFYRCFCDVCLPIGQRNREFYQTHGVKAPRLFDVPYTVDNEFFIDAVAGERSNIDALRAELDLPTGWPVVLFASKLTPRKRPLDLLVAYAQLRASGVEAGLIFVGAGELEANLRQYTLDHSVPNVCFMGFRNQSELPRFYSLADVFVLPSENEPWGLIINEAMCGALPIVASAEIGAALDLVRDGYNGFTFQAGHVPELANRLRELLTDADRRRQMGANSLALIREWNLDRSAQGVLSAMHSLKQ